MTWLWITLGLVLFAAALLVIISEVTLRIAVVRPAGRDWNFDPETDDPATFPASGDTPYRNASRDSNIWWNSQPLERLEIYSADGLRLVGNLLKAEKKTNRLAFVVHGHMSVSGEMGFISRMYHDRGYNVFCTDHRSHGKSDGKYIGMGFLEKDDMALWLSELIKKLGPDTEIVLHGLSMGAATVMMMSGMALPENVKCAVEDCGYTDAFDTFLSHMERDMKPLPFKKLIITTAGLISKRRIGYAFKEATALEAVKKSKLPMLFIHGTHDNVVPFEMMRKLYDAHGGAKKMLIVENAKHGVSYFVDAAAYESAVDGFVENYLK